LYDIGDIRERGVFVAAPIEQSIGGFDDVIAGCLGTHENGSLQGPAPSIRRRTESDNRPTLVGQLSESVKGRQTIEPPVYNDYRLVAAVQSDEGEPDAFGGARCKKPLLSTIPDFVDLLECRPLLMRSELRRGKPTHGGAGRDTAGCRDLLCG